MKPPVVNTQNITSLEDLKSDILSSKDKYVGVDTETNGLRWMAEDRAFGVSFAWDDQSAFIRNDNFGAENIGRLLEDVYRSEKTITFHNAEFDLHMIDVTYGVDNLPESLMDTLRVSHLFDTSANHSLKGWGTNVYGASVALHENILKEYRARYKIKDWSMLPSSILDPYAANDAVLTKALAIEFVPKLERDCPRLLKLETDLIPVIFDMEKIGLKVDLEYIGERRKYLKRAMREVDEQVFRLLGNKYLNMASPPQVWDYFYTRMKVKLYDKENDGEALTDLETGKEYLELIQSDYEGDTVATVAGLVLKWRGLKKEDDTYMQPYQELQVNGRLHPKWNACGTKTGRFSGSSPNVQNVTRGKEVRRVFIPDTHFFDFDYSQIEYRMAAFASGEMEMIEAFIQGMDYHSFTASRVFEKDVESITEEERRIGKTINFLTLYGGGAEKFAAQAKISVKKAKVYLKSYWSANKNLRKYTQSIIAKGTRNGFVHTLLGRKITLDDRAYAAPNYVIQGTAGDILKISLLRTAKIAKELGITICNTVHDQIVFDNMEHKHVPQIVEVMESFNFENEELGFSMPIIVDIKDGDKSWGEMGKEWTDDEKYGRVSRI